MKCENCKINEDIVEQGYNERDLECTCDSKQKLLRFISDWFISIPLIIIILVFALLTFPIIWLSDKIEEWSLK